MCVFLWHRLIKALRKHIQPVDNATQVNESFVVQTCSHVHLKETKQLKQSERRKEKSSSLLKALPRAHPYPNLSSIIALRFRAALFSRSFDYENMPIYSYYVLKVSFKMFRFAPSSLRFSSIIAGVEVFRSMIVTKTAPLKPRLCVYTESTLLAVCRTANKGSRG